MTKRLAALTSWSLLLLGIAAFAGSALADNGNGNGGANGQAGASPGNSANAPGQVKKSSAMTSSSGGGSASQNSPSTKGVKPTTATSHDTHCTLSSTGCASTGANATTNGSGDASKRYGNGTTAAQVAQSAGVTSGALHGPGNSQPHKMAVCPGGHEVDVHALKAKKNKSCGASQPTTSHHPTTSNNVSGNATSSSHAAAVSAAAGSTAQGASPQGGVLGVTTEAKGQPAGGVLGAIAAIGQGTLPFTGFPLWLAALTALSLVVFGLTLRRLGRETA